MANERTEFWLILTHSFDMVCSLWVCGYAFQLWSSLHGTIDYVCRIGRANIGRIANWPNRWKFEWIRQRAPNSKNDQQQQIDRASNTIKKIVQWNFRTEKSNLNLEWVRSISNRHPFLFIVTVTERVKTDFYYFWSRVLFFRWCCCCWIGLFRCCLVLSVIYGAVLSYRCIYVCLLYVCLIIKH